MEQKKMMEEEKMARTRNGIAALILTILGILVAIAGLVASAILLEGAALGISVAVCSILICILPILFCGLKMINPNEALVLVLFGKYYGTLSKEGFFWVNPFCAGVNPTASGRIITGTVGTLSTMASGEAGKNPAEVSTFSKKVSLKTCTLNNTKQKVNDELGNPIEIGSIVIWRVENSSKAVFNVDNYKTYISIQCDAVIRNVARCYPYDTSEAGEEWSLRGSSQEIAEIMKKELQEKVADAGIFILEVRITHLAYAPEIASAMLQRQQAVAIIDARQKIVEGAVSMVEMALNKLSENQVVELDEERKAAMVSNLLVVLCGNKDAQPIINSGSIY